MTLTRVLLLSAVLTIPAFVTADAAPRKASNTRQAETTGVATPDAPAVQIPARRARASVAPSAGPIEGMNTMPGVQSTIQLGTQCFMQTDSRGYGYWGSCERGYSYVDRSSDGGGGDGGGGSGGQ